MTESPFDTGDKYHNSSPLKKSPNLQGIIAAVIGMLLGRYTGIHFLIPLAFMGIAYLIYKKLLFKNTQLFFLEAAVLLCGHAAWGALGVLVLELQNQGLDQFTTMLNAIEFTLYFALSFYLLKNPTVLLAIVVMVVELLVIIVNIVAIAEKEIGSNDHKALASHLTIRVAIIVYAWIGMRKFNASLKVKAATPATTATETNAHETTPP
ncbi:MAG: hypothetical protein JNJ69_17465 [Leptospiraceae bacterium]|nr:hypothetical protein [Leptospiraceae bacterium]